MSRQNTPWRPTFAIVGDLLRPPALPSPGITNRAGIRALAATRNAHLARANELLAERGFTIADVYAAACRPAAVRARAERRPVIREEVRAAVLTALVRREVVAQLADLQARAVLQAAEQTAQRNVHRRLGWNV